MLDRVSNGGAAYETVTTIKISGLSLWKHDQGVSTSSRANHPDRPSPSNISIWPPRYIDGKQHHVLTQ